MSDEIPSKGIHHIAFATKDIKATYEFYNDGLGMPLAHTEGHRQGKGYFKHFFFDMGAGQYMGFFEVHKVGEKKDFRTDISMGLGLPPWVNHIAFDIGTKEEMIAVKLRLKEKRIKVMAEVDHDWCHSIYLLDPNMIMVEFTYTSDAAKFGQSHEEAYDLLFNTTGDDFSEETRKDVVD